MSSDPRDLSHELRGVPELLGTAGVAQNGWMASIWRPFLVKFGDFEFPAALAHFFGFKLLMTMCHCATVAMCHRHTRGGGWRRRVAAGGFARKSGATGSYSSPRHTPKIATPQLRGENDSGGPANQGLNLARGSFCFLTTNAET